MWGVDIPHVGCARSRVSALERKYTAWHAPSRHAQFPLTVVVPDNGSLIAGKDAGQRRHVACEVVDVLHEVTDRLLVAFIE